MSPKAVCVITGDVKGVVYFVQNVSIKAVPYQLINDDCAIKKVKKILPFRL